MSACPNCHQAIEIKSQHMGALFNCPHCGAVFFVDWNGQPEGMANHEPEPSAPAAESPSDPFPAENPPFESPLEMPVMGGDFSSPMTDEAPAAGENPLEGVPAVTEMSFESPAVPETFSPETFTPETSPAFQDSPLEAPAPDEGGMADVLNYGNQESTAGPLTYTVRIAGLELAETFEKLREALTDSRFGWEPEEVMSQVASGRLELKGLNPTKASILINRIKYLPIEVSWTQEVYGGTS